MKRILTSFFTAIVLSASACPAHAEDYQITAQSGRFSALATASALAASSEPVASPSSATASGSLAFSTTLVQSEAPIEPALLDVLKPFGVDVTKPSSAVTRGNITTRSKSGTTLHAGGDLEMTETNSAFLASALSEGQFELELSCAGAPQFRLHVTAGEDAMTIEGTEPQLLLLCRS